MLRVFVSAIFRSSQTCRWNLTARNVRTLASSTESAVDKVPTIDEVNDLFAEARLCLQDALESKGTVYFEDDYQDAKRVTEETLRGFQRLCAASDEDGRQSLLEANQPKMKQLEQEFKNLQDELINDE